ncbi:hypothetical protein N7468_008922 [Penicillium chermesinum]|uniref:F-box domain-containing protein n=1 Tax=Penicillium chermesinum TaxID=63820 RepID=A0A9W9NH88_9EURO|nr:uncharacterized protein N7468_008922 [Penicillium chermesinum]KAJ5219718.1 hypothetical protein N7468_008922 [Penicillium chermesinum]
MAQLWRVIAPERKETTGSLGTLDEALLSGSAAGLVPLLAVPLHQHRFVATPRRRQAITNNSSVEISSAKVARVRTHDSQPIAPNAPKTLSSLSSHVHCIIFRYLDNPFDALRLSLTNRYFWAVGLRRLEDFIMESLAPWAGERIVCVSDESDPRAIPDEILNETEKADLEELKGIYDLSNSAPTHGWRTVGAPVLPEELRKFVVEYEATHPMSEADHAEIMMGLKPEMLDFYPRDQPWILRNLTTKEYVRGEVIALKGEFVQGPNIEVLGFAEILVSRISWSSREAYFGRDKNLAHGKWAGHRFDITTLPAHEERAGNDGWRDVSDEVLRDLDVIIGSQKGDDWREHMSRRRQKSISSMRLGYT